jgi:hypothetical protein
MNGIITELVGLVVAASMPFIMMCFDLALDLFEVALACQSHSLGVSTIGCVHVFYCVASMREVQLRLRDEVDQLFDELENHPSGEKQSITLDRLHAMTFLGDVVTEALRLYPFSTFLFRNVVKDITIGGVPFYSGEKVVLNNYAHCRNPALMEGAWLIYCRL